ncbi:MAG: lytic transglycosylase domain-containing protein [Deltaproteobacteria bacterium]|nr:lytic transglycosylase domain-containing protein [Deltaproteobacteria bacterium]
MATSRGHVPRTPLRPISATHAARLAHYAPVIGHCAAKYGVPVPLICGVILQESGGNPKAVSPAGARGLMQLMPATARRMGVTNIMDPRQNIEGGVRYLRFLLDRFKGNVKLAVAAYNCGEGNVEKYGNRIPPFRETQGYVPNVLSYAQTVHQILGSAPAGVARVEPARPSGPSLAGRFAKLA